MAARESPTVWRRAGGFLSRRTPRSILVAGPSSDVLVLSGVAVIVWEELARGHDDSSLVAAVAERLATDADDIANDVVAGRARPQRRRPCRRSDMTRSPVQATLRMVAAEGLRASHPQYGAALVPDSSEDFLKAVTEQRLTGLAIESVRGGALELTESRLDDLFDRHEDQLALDLRLERLLC